MRKNGEMTYPKHRAQNWNPEFNLAQYSSPQTSLGFKALSPLQNSLTVGSTAQRPNKVGMGNLREKNSPAGDKQTSVFTSHPGSYLKSSCFSIFKTPV